MYTHKRLIILLVVIAIGVALLLVSPPALDNSSTGLEGSKATNVQWSMTTGSDIPSIDNSEPVAWLLRIDGAIGPATSDYVTRNLAAAALSSARLLVLTIDTPGGLDSSMREIIQAILDSPIPVASFVHPQGARAASAGTYILYASHIAAMAPATNLGAATPVQIGAGFGIPGQKKPDGNDDNKDPSARDMSNPMKNKNVNDAVAYIRGLADLRGRNIEWAEQAVRMASSLSAREALEMNVIDLMANDVADLLQKIDGRELTIKGQNIELDTRSVGIEEILPDRRNRFLSVITDPNVAYILMLIGIYGLFLEFYSPGAIVPGVAGAISLLIALYAFQVLPVNFAGLALIGLGILLIIMEAFVPSTGILGIGGVIAFIVGSVILMDTDSDAFQIAIPLILAVALFSVIVLIMMASMILRERNRAQVSGDAAMIGEMAEIMEDFSEQGLVSVHGELWQAVTKKPVHKGQMIPIKTIQGLKLCLQNNMEDSGDPS